MHNTIQKRIDSFHEEMAVYSSKLSKISVFRVIYFFVAVGLIFLLRQQEVLMVLLLSAGLILGFLALVFWYQRERKKKDLIENLVHINELELDRLKYKFESLPSGRNFLDPSHPFSYDFDVFGDTSLFGFISRTQTTYGTQELNKYLLNPHDIDFDIQSCTRELEEKVDFRQDLQALGLAIESEKDNLDTFSIWEKEELKNFGKWVRPTLTVLSVITFGSIIAYFYGMVPGLVPSLLLVSHIILIYTQKSFIGKLYDSITGKAPVLEAYAGVLGRIEQESFQNPHLNEVAGALKEDPPASTIINSLSKLAYRLELRNNGLFYVVVNILFFWDLHHCIQLLDWKNNHLKRVFEFFTSLGKIEALSSIAGLSWVFPDWIYPEILSGNELKVEGEGMGHPLISPEVRKSNPISQTHPGQIDLITGSNMAGKSTYLRSIGLNMILGMIGCRVPSKSLSFTPARIISSMRTSDSLKDNTSSFYAELRKIKEVIGLVEKKETVMVFLDEILKGTNSADRHKGAGALIRQLIDLKGNGLVSTHDLELTVLEKELGADRLRNFHFASDLTEDGNMIFDYQRKDGPCASFNATFLMKSMGVLMK